MTEQCSFRYNRPESRVYADESQRAEVGRCLLCSGKIAWLFRSLPPSKSGSFGQKHDRNKNPGAVFSGRVRHTSQNYLFYYNRRNVRVN